MRLLLATDAWAPQVNGVVRCLQATIHELSGRGVHVDVLSPDQFRSVPMPSYPEIRLAMVSRRSVADRLRSGRYDAVHVATEGPIGWAVRGVCQRLSLSFTTSYHTRFPEYVRARAPVPERWSYALLKRFHGAGASMMVATPSMMRELAALGFSRLAMWSFGVDTNLFRPERAIATTLPPDLPRPIFITVARVAVEKNLGAFLDLDLPGSKMVVGDGPARAELQARYPDVVFTGFKSGEELAALYAAADVFVFPSLTDTFGLVLLEASACGLPIAAFPVQGPRDVIGGHPVGILAADLRAAALAAMAIPREACRAFALRHSWAAATDQFLAGLVRADGGGGLKLA
jgi:glycosyltransferase involved in cell wall biosynthesis